MGNNREKVLKNFIVFEGIDGRINSARAMLLCEDLKRLKKRAILTREPTENKIGKLIKELIKNDDYSVRTLSLLFASDRDDHLNNKAYGIKSLLDKGNYVICDRYFYSSLVYQSDDFEYTNLINDFELPEYLFYVDVTAQEAMKRIEAIKDEKDIFEKRIEIFKKAKSNYDRLFKCLPKEVNFKVISRNIRTEDEIIKMILKEK